MNRAKEFLFLITAVLLCSCSDGSESDQTDQAPSVTGDKDKSSTDTSEENGDTGKSNTGDEDDEDDEDNEDNEGDEGEQTSDKGTGGKPIDEDTPDSQTQSTDDVTDLDGGADPDSTDLPGSTADDVDGTIQDGETDEPCDIDLEPEPGADKCSAPIKPGEERRCDFQYNGAQRHFYMYAPTSYNPCKPASLIVDCHGMSESAEVHIGKQAFNGNGPLGYGSGWRSAVHGDNAVVATPQGVRDAWNAQTDVGFLNQVADKMEKIANIDLEKVYITGISMGGMITYATGCADTKRWRGMSGVAALIRGNPCQNIARPLPVISFHARGDQLTSYEDDRARVKQLAQHNNCKNGPVDAKVFGGPNSDPDPVCYETPPTKRVNAPDPRNIPLIPCPASSPPSTCVKWDQCDEGVELMFCTVDAHTQQLGGHILYTNDTGLSLGATAWAFFKRFQK